MFIIILLVLILLVLFSKTTIIGGANDIYSLLDELELNLVKLLDGGWNGDTYLVSNGKNEFILKLEKIDATPTGKEFESEYYRQLDFDKLVAKNHPDKFLTIEKHGIIKNCKFTHSKTEIVEKCPNEIRRARFIRKNKQPDCYYLLYSPVLEGTFRNIRDNLTEPILLDLMKQLIESINIYRKLGFIHTDISFSNIMFKTVNGKYEWYWIDYGNITNIKYPDSYLDLERLEKNPSCKNDMKSDLLKLVGLCTTHMFKHGMKKSEREEFANYVKTNNKKIYDEIIEYLPDKDLNLFVMVYKLLYPQEYIDHFKCEHNETKLLLKDVLLLCIKHSSDETYDKLLKLLNEL